MKTSTAQSGQVILIIILTIIVAMTVAMAIYLTSLTDTHLTSTQERSENSFNVAEAGVEDILSRDDNEIQAMIGNTNNIHVGTTNSTDVELEQLNMFEFHVNQNDVATIKIVGATADAVKIEWSHADCASAAGLVIERWREFGGDPFVERYAISAHSCTAPDGFQAANNAFSLTSNYNSQVIFGLSSYQDVTLSVRDTALVGNAAADPYDTVLRIHPAFNNTNLRVIAVNTTNGSDIVDGLPLQSVDITSTSTDAESLESRSVEVNRTMSDLPAIFDYALYSGDDLVK